MNKQQAITHFKQIIAVAKQGKEVAMQNYNTATQLESEANSALEKLGVSPGQARKGKHKLPDKDILKIRANFTK
ncbi:hypothetical protein Q765_03160 [Flavobacterium rivuli WB 3.3-2 = DSM 21788]|uniref:Uncharacterized protein n=1 Tax=Flavobacterium rivuli WB 3.3-2 = DSM 21788 TaxID=1121895 RepID=A0A0A2M709_9FLAO|nr:hypothetical protein [Flavobacterium rivuli]KGO88069.1 hypothetical protein Q765_03160 [Flavobacterium rivuli WB 3.3-2 = DSM 21788]